MINQKSPKDIAEGILFNFKLSRSQIGDEKVFKKLWVVWDILQLVFKKFTKMKSYSTTSIL